MQFIIVGVAIIIYFILIAWTYQSLGFIEKSKKIMFILVGILIMYIATLIIFQITKRGINYPNEGMKESVQNILVIIFTGINGILVMPQIGKMLDKINEDQMKPNELKKIIIVLIVVIMICLVFEVGYMKDTQEGILKMYHTMQGN